MGAFLGTAGGLGELRYAVRELLARVVFTGSTGAAALYRLWLCRGGCGGLAEGAVEEATNLSLSGSGGACDSCLHGLTFLFEFEGWYVDRVGFDYDSEFALHLLECVEFELSLLYFGGDTLLVELLGDHGAELVLERLAGLL